MYVCVCVCVYMCVRVYTHTHALQAAQLESTESVKELIERCVQYVDPEARVKIATKRRDVLEVTVLKSEVNLCSYMPVNTHNTHTYTHTRHGAP